MKPSSKPRPARSVVLGDGYVGMNVIPRRDGRTSGLDHFGIEVDDVEDTIARIAKFDSSLGAVKRPPIRPFAAYSAHDPEDRKSTRLNSSHLVISYAVFCLKKKNKIEADRLFVRRSPSH